MNVAPFMYICRSNSSRSASSYQPTRPNSQDISQRRTTEEMCFRERHQEIVAKLSNLLSLKEKKEMYTMIEGQRILNVLDFTIEHIKIVLLITWLVSEYASPQALSELRALMGQSPKLQAELLQMGDVINEYFMAKGDAQDVVDRLTEDSAFLGKLSNRLMTPLIIEPTKQSLLKSASITSTRELLSTYLHVDRRSNQPKRLPSPRFDEPHLTTTPRNEPSSSQALLPPIGGHKNSTSSMRSQQSRLSSMFIPRVQAPSRPSIVANTICTPSVYNSARTSVVTVQLSEDSSIEEKEEPHAVFEKLKLFTMGEAEVRRLSDNAPLKMTGSAMQLTMNLAQAIKQWKSTCKDIIGTLSENPALFQGLLDEYKRQHEDRLPHEVKRFVQALTNIRELMSNKVRTTFAEQAEIEDGKKWVYTALAQNKAAVNELQNKLMQETGNSDIGVKEHDEAVFALKKKIVAVDLKSTKYRKKISDSCTDTQDTDRQKHLSRFPVLKERYLEMCKQMRDNRKINVADEATQRMKCQRLEIAIEEMFRQYDQDMAKKQEEIDCIQEAMEIERKHIEDMEKKVAELQPEYSVAMENRALRESLLRMRQRTLWAVAVIQTWWREYKRQKDDRNLHKNLARMNRRRKRATRGRRRGKTKPRGRRANTRQKKSRSGGGGGKQTRSTSKKPRSASKPRDRSKQTSKSASKTRTPIKLVPPVTGDDDAADALLASPADFTAEVENSPIP